MMNTMVVVIMYGSNIVDDYNDYDGCIVFFCFIRFYLAHSVDPHLLVASSILSRALG